MRVLLSEIANKTQFFYQILKETFRNVSPFQCVFSSRYVLTLEESNRQLNRENYNYMGGAGVYDTIVQSEAVIKKSIGC